ncbi:MEKHLA domain-containing protein [Akkermansiaceae bacterium]|nr:MEKHLA domain-containing protein [Akkermansiaceae bacterium]
MLPEPDAENGFHAGHVADLLRSHHALTGKHLIPPAGDAARLAYDAPFVLLSHDGADPPLLSYGNLAAQDLFAMDWGSLVGTPSRETAEAPERTEREDLLRRVAESGFIDDYSGIRIAADGRRFRICNATVWNVSDEQGKRIGQAAAFSHWEPLG